MANNIYVGGFPYKTSKEDLAKLFSTCGTVLSAKVILDRETGRPKGFGFIEMSTDAEATAAVAKLNGAFIGDRKILSTRPSTTKILRSPMKAPLSLATAALASSSVDISTSGPVLPCVSS